MKSFKVVEITYICKNKGDKLEKNITKEKEFETQEKALAYAQELENQWCEKYNNGEIDPSICAVDVNVEVWENKKLVEFTNHYCPDF